MDDRAAKFGSGLAALAVLWIAIYWLWTPGTGGLITFDSREPDPVVHVSRSPERSPPLDESGTSPSNETTADPESAGDEGPSPESPGPSPEEEPAPRLIPPEFREYVVQADDTFGSIAQRELGSSRWATASCPRRRRARRTR